MEHHKEALELIKIVGRLLQVVVLVKEPWVILMRVEPQNNIGSSVPKVDNGS